MFVHILKDQVKALKYRLNFINMLLIEKKQVDIDKKQEFQASRRSERNNMFLFTQLRSK